MSGFLVVACIFDCTLWLIVLRCSVCLVRFQIFGFSLVDLSFVVKCFVIFCGVFSVFWVTKLCFICV